jgi:hypothetical protein
MHGLDLHVRVQRGPSVHLHDGRIGWFVLFVLPWGELMRTNESVRLRLSTRYASAPRHTGGGVR